MLYDVVEVLGASYIPPTKCWESLTASVHPLVTNKLKSTNL